MKKSLVLAMAMAMGVTASAYAANPFSDVAAGHWAYDSINKLAAAGVIDGYGATFGGEKLMTRYEMAQIVAKAMAKGANVDKLAAEFADELDALGVRVSKLEKKVDNVKVTGQIRYSYADVKGKLKYGTYTLKDGSKLSPGVVASAPKHNTEHRMRNRFFVEGKVNDNWTYTGMLENNKFFNNKASSAALGNDDKSGNDKLSLVRAYMDGRIGGLKVRAGHWNEFFINDTILDDMIDGVQVSYDFKGFNFFGLAAKWASDGANGNLYHDDGRLYVLGVSKKVQAIDFAFNYFKTTGSVDGYDYSTHSDVEYNLGRNIYSLNADWAIDHNWGLTYRYMWTDDRVPVSGDINETAGAKDGFFAQLNYRGADPSKAGTWGLRARYFEQPQNVWLYPTYDAQNFYNFGGYKGWNFGGSYTFAKNIFLDVDYYDTESKAKYDEGKSTSRKLYSQLWFLF